MRFIMNWSAICNYSPEGGRDARWGIIDWYHDSVVDFCIRNWCTMIAFDVLTLVS